MSKILLTYFSFVLACLVVVVAFLTATTYIQLAVAILLYPLLVYFAYKIFPEKLMRYTPSEQPATVQMSTRQTATFESGPREKIGISDIDKRVFLKLIGSTGLFLFLFSLFNKKTESLFFKSLPAPARLYLEGSDGQKVDSAQNQPLDGYRISEIEDNDVSFYGFINKDGAWYVMRVDADTGSFRYVRGESNFPEHWSNRENLDYDYFNSVFKQ